MAGCSRHGPAWFSFLIRLDSQLGTFALWQYVFSWADFTVSLAEVLWPACFRECGAKRSICLSADGSEKESLRICLNDDLHSSSWLDARVLLAEVGCLKSVTLRCFGNVMYHHLPSLWFFLRSLEDHLVTPPRRNEIYQIELNQEPSQTLRHVPLHRSFSRLLVSAFFYSYIYDIITFHHINPGTA